MLTNTNCGTCRFHDVRYCQNGNGKCTNPDSPRIDVVTGKQGCCAGYQEGNYLYILANQLALEAAAGDAFNAQALAAIDVFNRGQPPQPAAAAPKSPPAGHPFDDPLPF